MPIIFIPLAFLFLFFRELWDVFRDPRRASMLVWIAILFAAGTIYYVRAEHWSYTDALYFSVVTLATVGFGDLTPTTTATKMFTVIYILSGLSIFIAFVNTLADERKRIHEHREDVIHDLRQKERQHTD